MRAASPHVALDPHRRSARRRSGHRFGGAVRRAAVPLRGRGGGLPGADGRAGRARALGPRWGRGDGGACRRAARHGRRGARHVLELPGGGERRERRGRAGGGARGGRAARRAARARVDALGRAADAARGALPGRRGRGVPARRRGHRVAGVQVRDEQPYARPRGPARARRVVRRGRDARPVQGRLGRRRRSRRERRRRGDRGLQRAGVLRPQQRGGPDRAPGAPFGAPRTLVGGRGDPAPAVAVAPDGRALVAVGGMSHTGEVYERAPGGEFGPAQPIELGPTSRTPLLALRADGAAVVASAEDWTSPLVAVTRGAPGAFGPRVELVPGRPRRENGPMGFGFNLPEANPPLEPYPESTVGLGADGRALLVRPTDERDERDPRGLQAVTFPAAGPRAASAGQLAATALAGPAHPRRLLAVERTTLGGGIRDAAGFSPLTLADGRFAVAWSDDRGRSDSGPRDGRLHLAIDGAGVAPEPAVPVVTAGVPERRALRPAQPLAAARALHRGVRRARGRARSPTRDGLHRLAPARRNDDAADRARQQGARAAPWPVAPHAAHLGARRAHGPAPDGRGLAAAPPRTAAPAGQRPARPPGRRRHRHALAGGCAAPRRLPLRRRHARTEPRRRRGSRDRRRSTPPRFAIQRAPETGREGAVRARLRLLVRPAAEPFDASFGASHVTLTGGQEHSAMRERAMTANFYGDLSLNESPAPSVRHANRVRMLQALLRHPARSRADLGRSLGLSRATVTALLNELELAGMVEQQRHEFDDDRPPAIGRPPLQVSLAPTRRVRRRAGLRPPPRPQRRLRPQRADRRRPVGGHRDRPAPARARSTSPQRLTIAALDRGGRGAVARRRRGGRAGRAGRRAPPGSSTPTGILPGWDGVQPAVELEARLGMPVQVENDANAGAMGEHLFGAGRGVVGHGLPAALRRGRARPDPQRRVLWRRRRRRGRGRAHAGRSRTG